MTITTIADSETAATLTGFRSSVLITSTGSLNNDTDAVTFDSADYGFLSNAGQVLSQASAISIDNNSVGSLIVNQVSGGITGDYGISNAGGDTTIHNDGLIDGRLSGVHSTGNELNLVNSGQILSRFMAVEIFDPASYLFNSGTIVGGQYCIRVDSSTQVCSIRNTGTMIGDVFLGASNTDLVNSGIVQGSIMFFQGINSFNGHGGTVTGSIIGGSGVDTILAGNDGETIGGGAGHDVLYAGKGDDTFTFATYASADSDVIHKFTESTDQIELDSSVFTKLKSGSVPEFTIGTSPIDAKDYLYYDANTGNLYYDTNGSAAGGNHLVATLDPHLALTAADFVVENDGNGARAVGEHFSAPLDPHIGLSTTHIIIA